MNMNVKPNFFILGAAKCGTTSLSSYLKQHPRVYLPRLKELHFFDNDKFWEKGLDWYLKRHFRKAAGYPARGEATPAYFHCGEKVIARMKEVYANEAPKFILIFRDPVERAWSHYLHCVRMGIESEPFDRALELEEERLAKNPSRWVGYFRDGLYAKQLRPWLNAFPRENFFFLIDVDLKTDIIGSLKAVCEFLGVNPNYTFRIQKKYNVVSYPRSRIFLKFLNTPSPLKRPIGLLLGPYWSHQIKRLLWRLNSKPYKTPPRLDPVIRLHLTERYRQDVLELQELIGRDLSCWWRKEL